MFTSLSRVGSLILQNRWLVLLPHSISILFFFHSRIGLALLIFWKSPWHFPHEMVSFPLPHAEDDLEILTAAKVERRPILARPVRQIADLLPQDEFPSCQIHWENICVEDHQIQHEENEENCHYKRKIAKPSVVAPLYEPYREIGQHRQQSKLETKIYKEVALVSFTHTGSNPWTVMIISWYASLTFPAVFSSNRLLILTLTTVSKFHIDSTFL